MTGTDGRVTAFEGSVTGTDGGTSTAAAKAAKMAKKTTKMEKNFILILIFWLASGINFEKLMKLPRN